MGARVTTDELVAALARCRQRIKVLRDDNQRIWESREQWKRKHASRQAEVQTLRRRVKRLEKYLTYYRRRAVPHRTPKWKNIHLSEQDVARILAMPVRRD